MNHINLLIAIVLLLVIFGLFRFNTINKDTVQEQLGKEELQGVKGLADKAGVKLDQYLAEEKEEYEAEEGNFED